MDFYVKAVNELSRIFDALNKEYFNDELRKPVITIMTGKKNVLGWFWKERWSDDTESYDELNITAENLKRDKYGICATLQHENIHLYCYLNEIKDTSNKNVYHNMHFKEEAQKRGLIIEKRPTIGWSATTPTEDFKKFVDSLEIDDSVFNFFRVPPIVLSGGGNTNSSEKTTKYTCPGCGASVRGMVGLELECKKCDMEMEPKKID